MIHDDHLDLGSYLFQLQAELFPHSRLEIRGPDHAGRLRSWHQIREPSVCQVDVERTVEGGSILDRRAQDHFQICGELDQRVPAGSYTYTPYVVCAVRACDNTQI